MLRYSMWATVAALAVWVATPDLASARAGHGGGGHGGGGHGGGGHGGGGHGGGGFHSGGFHGGGFHDGGFKRGFNRGGFYGGYGGFYGLGYGYGYPYYGGYGGYYGGYDYPSTVYYNDTYVVPNTTQSLYFTPDQTTTTAVTDNRARIRVRVPSDAALWIDGQPTQQTGSAREFVTPPLDDPSTTYTYTMKARWMQGTEPVEKTMKVDVRANQTSVADFMR